MQPQLSLLCRRSNEGHFHVGGSWLVSSRPQHLNLDRFQLDTQNRVFDSICSLSQEHRRERVMRDQREDRLVCYQNHYAAEGLPHKLIIT